ncbi:MAG: DUF308 domain-containing protein [Dorea sp.]
MNIKTMLKVKYILFPALGIICIFFAENVTFVLPYLLGGAMIIVGALIGLSYFQEKRFLEKQSDELAYGIIMFIMGIAFLIKGSDALETIGITWAIIGIRKAAKSLNLAIRQIYSKKHFITLIVEFLIRITLALLLLFNPLEKFSKHVVILGLELIVISIPFTKFFSRITDLSM